MALVTGTACLTCGPGITVTASSATGSLAAHVAKAASMARAGSGSVLPSTNCHRSVLSTTAASASSDSGNGCFPGVVDNGL